MHASEKRSVPRQILYDCFGRLLLESDLSEIFRLHDVKKCLDYRIMEHEQRVVIKFVANESVAHEIHTKLNSQFAGQTYALRTC
jgi:hypothetical protein